MKTIDNFYTRFETALKNCKMSLNFFCTRYNINYTTLKYALNHRSLLSDTETIEKMRYFILYEPKPTPVAVDASKPAPINPDSAHNKFWTLYTRIRLDWRQI